MCGAVRYECSAELIEMGICHCQDCQRGTDSAFAAVLIAPRSAVTITEDMNEIQENLRECASLIFRHTGTIQNPRL